MVPAPVIVNKFITDRVVPVRAPFFDLDDEILGLGIEYKSPDSFFLYPRTTIVCANYFFKDTLACENHDEYYR